MVDRLDIHNEFKKQRGLTISTVITRIVLLCMLPLFLLAAAMAIYQVDDIRREQADRAAALAENAVHRIDDFLDVRIRALNMLALSPLTDDLSQLYALYNEAQDFRRTFGTHIVVVDGGTPAHLLLNTRVPFGTELPVVEKANGRLAAQRALMTGKPAISDLFAGPVAKEPLIGIAVPVIREGKGKFAIVTTVDRNYFQESIEHFALPPDWSILLKDAQGARIAGRPKNPIEIPSARFFASSPLSRWTVTVEVPRMAFWRSLIWAAVALGAIILGVTFAGFIGGKLAGRRLGRSVASLAKTPAPGTPPPDILEIAAARHLLDQETHRREAAENTLRKSENLYRELVENANSAIIRYKRDGAITFFNRYAEVFFGYDEDEVIGRHVNMLLPEKDSDGRDLVREIVDHPDRYEKNVNENICRNGRRVWMAWTNRLIHDETGNVKEILAVGADITDRKRAEEALAESERRYRTVGETIPYGIWQTDATGACTFVSESFLEMTGMSWPEIQQFGWLDLLPPEDRNPTRNHWMDCVQTGEDYQREQRFRAKDGSIRSVLAIGRPIRKDKGSDIEGWVGINLDITDRKKAEQALRKANDELEQRVKARTAELKQKNLALEEYAANLANLNKELQEFAFIASHDLQEPLRKVQIFGNILLDRFKDPLGEQGKDYLLRLTGAAERMSQLLKSLLEYSRVTTHTKHFERIELGAVLDDVTSDLELIIRKSGVAVEIDRLPAIYADINQMRQLFQNLIGNAIKYKKDVERAIVKISAIEEGGKCRITIQDNGIGFDEQYANQIFKPFQRLHGRSAYEGTGMGLAICRKVVERHRGSITAKSTPGQGSVFTVELPTGNPGL